MRRKPLIEVYSPRPASDSLDRTYRPSDGAPEPPAPPPAPPKAISVINPPKESK